jgi:hypothetical protein
MKKEGVSVSTEIVTKYTSRLIRPLGYSEGFEDSGSRG